MASTPLDLGPRPDQGLHAGRDRGPRAERRFGRHRRGRVRRRHGPVRLGQVDVHEPDRLPRHADLRQLPARRRGRRAHGSRRAGRRAQPPDRLRVPAVQPAAAHVGAGERRTAAAVRRHPAGGAARRSAQQARRRGPRRPRAPSPVAALRRPAAARRDRAGAGQRSQADPRRRADRRTRLDDQRRGDGAAAGAQPQRHHHRRRHPRARHRRLCVAPAHLPRRPPDRRRAERAGATRRRWLPRRGSGRRWPCHELPRHAAHRACRAAHQQAALGADDAGHHHRRRRRHHHGRRRRRRAGAGRGPDQEPRLQPHHHPVRQLHLGRRAAGLGLAAHDHRGRRLRAAARGLRRAGRRAAAARLGPGRVRQHQLVDASLRHHPRVPRGTAVGGRRGPRDRPVARRGCREGRPARADGGADALRGHRSAGRDRAHPPRPACRDRHPRPQGAEHDRPGPGRRRADPDLDGEKARAGRNAGEEPQRVAASRSGSRTVPT